MGCTCPAQAKKDPRPRMDELSETLRFFGLREQPFAPTADPAYFYATQANKECLYQLWNNIDERHGIAVVLGNYGTGKTTLLRKLLTGMSADPARYCTAVIGSPIPSWSSFALLEAIVAQFGLQPAEASFVSCMEALNRHLLANRHRVCTLVIDDAQNLNKRGQIELLRLIQNLETEQHKLLNLVFFAQLEWAQVLRAAPNFEQRVNVTFTLQPLPLEDLRVLLDFRLSQAIGDPALAPKFDDGALRALHAYGGGSPRMAVTVCRNALGVAAQRGVRTITQDLVLETIDKTTLPEPERRARLGALIAPAGVATAVRPEAPAPPAGAPAPRAAPPAPAVPQDARAALLTPLAAMPAADETPVAEPAPLAPVPKTASREARAANMLLRAQERRGSGNP